MVCHITGKRQNSEDLPQGKLELPCNYVCMRHMIMVEMQHCLTELSIQSVELTSSTKQKSQV